MMLFFIFVGVCKVVVLLSLFENCDDNEKNFSTLHNEKQLTSASLLPRGLNKWNDSDDQISLKISVHEVAPPGLGSPMPLISSMYSYLYHKDRDSSLKSPRLVKNRSRSCDTIDDGFGTIFCFVKFRLPFDPTYFF